jgi:hypothetical protein
LLAPATADGPCAETDFRAVESVFAKGTIFHGEYDIFVVLDELFLLNFAIQETKITQTGSKIRSNCLLTVLIF